MIATRWMMSGLLVGLGMMIGCAPTNPPTKATPKAAKHADDHDHGEAPHGGTIIEFGKYHAELTIDHAKKSATVYILSGNLKSGVPIAVESLLLSLKSPTLQLTLKPAPLSNDPEGKASRFTVTDERFAQEAALEGTLSGQIDGKPYLGDFKHSEADHKHDHKHD
ncbi:hypothetical protein [Tuwongella immobilis]|uniref:Lipoprotein n=1 Tax=Tuwongella immobilis TaxID=692036 RepID=A0A6C2YU18_9BACT|nr:hypothetical protein [Tuwongella immobilis]VIP04847.1 Uncharacterized protein OS=Rhodopirellula baltica SH28 GN=RBSH_03200 PE=4 SV=1 [Tuwongella immobilis]VTS07054.1 Uncharacterized protein OS=Rhodopirellula baltica SH28 GN=RBSH_03200 PE=4 SV=1 [Tuwongella immobilis]